MKNIITWMFVGLLMLVCIGIGYLSVALAAPVQAEAGQPLSKIFDFLQSQVAAIGFLPRHSIWHMLAIIIILALNGMFYLHWLSRMSLATVYEYVEIDDTTRVLNNPGGI